MYKICQRCVMDTSDPAIQFDEGGICNHCKEYAERAGRELGTDASNKEKLDSLRKEIKDRGKGQRYDCVIGVSGGVDSTYVAYLVKQMGFRPLAIHLDNGWNSELAVKNIEQTVKTLDIDLITHVVDWEEFKQIQLSLLKASVSNIETITDHAIMALLFQLAARENIRYIISGGNVASEAIMPESWLHDNRDWRFIRGIHRRFSNVAVNTVPHCSLIRYAYYVFLRGIKYVPLLNYVNYIKADAKALLQTELGWRDYGGKHYESIITRFFQAYILPTKFNIDKRRAHFATLVLSRQMTRVEALLELEKPLYDPVALRQDTEFFLKKMELTPEEFDKMMSNPIKSSNDYASNNWLFVRARFLIRFIKHIVRPASLRST